MDINLHSFILVVGLIVILFIVIDGIKKVREARSNQFNDDILNGDLLTSDVDLGHQEESSFREFEIADDLVSGSFVSDHTIDQRTVENQVESFEAEEPTDVLDDVATLDEPAEEDSPVLDEGIETDDPDGQVYSADLNSDALESFSVDTDYSEVADISASVLKNKTPVQPRKIHSDQPSKSEVESRRKEIQAAQLTEVELAPLDDIPETVPVLMEPVELGGEVDLNPPHQQEMNLPEFVQQTLQDEPIVATKTEPDFESFTIDDVEGFDDGSEKGGSISNAKPDKRELPVGERLEQRPPAEEIFVINVLKESGPLLKGSDLHHIFNACDMRHGEMSIFHRFEKENAQGKIQFSVVDALKPGTFDLSTIDGMETKGISMFMSLPGPEDPMAAFDAMAEVGLVFARNFSASLHDESHSDLTPQTLEHYRNRIREYSRKQFSKK